MIIQDKIIENIKGKVIVKTENDQNTDDIVPARFLKEITFEKMGDYVYIDERIKGGRKIEDHPFNRPEAKEAKILIAGANYGCGSSREHAPQALHRFGINAIIAESFAEIFAGNCVSLGIVCVTIFPEAISNLIDYVENNPEEELEVDLESEMINWREYHHHFEIPEGKRQAFLSGTWDAMAILQQNQEGIKKIEEELSYLKF